MDKYTEDIIKKIKNAKSKQEIADIIDSIWNDGYDCGVYDADRYYARYFYYD